MGFSPESYTFMTMCRLQKDNNFTVIFKFSDRLCKLLLNEKNLINMEYIYNYKSPLGDIRLSSDGTSLIGLWFNKQKYFADSLNEKYEFKSLPIFDETINWLDIYFSGKAPNFTPKIKMKTTDFRKSVWEIMLTIPYGETMTYGKIAKIIAKQKGLSKMSAQAVGGAVSHNSISLIIPCHRVVGTNGNLTGYAGGIDKKIKLLRLEKADMSRFFIPKRL